MARPPNLNRLAYFAAVVEAGSFTAAARRLAVTKAVVSQQIRRLEQDVGTALLIRTTRQLLPTDEGRNFYRRCAQVLQQAEEAFQELGQETDRPSGTLRITAPYDYGGTVLAPAASRFIKLYPSVRVELRLTDVRLDLIAERIDIAIRVGWLKDSSLQTRRIGSFRQLLVGLPEFAPLIETPDMIGAVNWVANAALSDPLDWEFEDRAGRLVAVRAHSGISTDTTLSAHACVRAGGGISILPDYLVREDLKLGNLVHLLPEWSLPEGGIHAVFPPSRFRPAKVRAFLDVLAD